MVYQIRDQRVYHLVFSECSIRLRLQWEIIKSSKSNLHIQYNVSLANHLKYIYRIVKSNQIIAYFKNTHKSAAHFHVP